MAAARRDDLESAAERAADIRACACEYSVTLPAQWCCLMHPTLSGARRYTTASGAQGICHHVSVHNDSLQRPDTEAHQPLPGCSEPASSSNCSWVCMLKAQHQDRLHEGNPALQDRCYWTLNKTAEVGEQPSDTCCPGSLTALLDIPCILPPIPARMHPGLCSWQPPPCLCPPACPGSRVQGPGSRVCCLKAVP